MGNLVVCFRRLLWFSYILNVVSMKSFPSHHRSLPALVVALGLTVLSGKAQTFSGQAIAHLPHARWQNPLPTGYQLNDLAVLNDSTAIVVGDHGTALKTTNRGGSWRVLDTGSGPARCNLLFVTFADERNGWIGYNTPKTNDNTQYFTGRGEVRHTTDGGLTWTRQALGINETSVRLWALQAVSPTEAFVVYDATTCSVQRPCSGVPGTQLRHTTDGGRTWPLVGPPTQALPLDGVNYKFQFTSPQVAYATASWDLLGTSTVMKSADGGFSWRRITPDSLHPAGFGPPSFRDPLHGWVYKVRFSTGTNDTLLYSTNDGGQTWLPHPVSGVSWIQAMTWADAQHGLLVDGYGTASGEWLTADGGQTWTSAQQVLLPAPNRLSAVRLTPAGTAWVVGSWGDVRVSRDWGNTWQPANVAVTTATLRRVQVFAEERTGWAVPLRDSVLLRTRRGQPWERVALKPTTPQINWNATVFVLDASFVDADSGFVLVRDSDPTRTRTRHWVVRTTNGGQAWTAAELPLPVNWDSFRVPSLRFRTARRGVFAGKDGLLLVTQDGGLTWQQPPSGTHQRLAEISWLDDQTAWVSADSAVFVKTMDGGVSWTASLPPPQSSYADPSYEQYYFTSRLVGYHSVGNLPPRWTNDGGVTWQTSIADSATRNGGGYRDPSVTSVSFPAKHRGWGFGTTDWYRTGDAGHTWQRTVAGMGTGQSVSPGNPTPTLGVALDFYNAWGVGDGGQILAYSEKYIQTDTSATQRLSYCTGDTLTVAFDTTGVFAVAERNFRVELSNAMGRFRPNETTLLPLVGSAAASPLRAVLPATLPAGTRYRLRVIRADSSVLGGDNGRDVTIWMRPGAVAVSPADSARLCAGDSVQLTAPAGYAAYQWRDGVRGRTRWVRQAGAYAVQVANGGGCFGLASAAVQVRVTPLPAPPSFTSQPQSSGIVVLTSSSPTGNQWYLNGQPIAGATGQQYAVTLGSQSGTYTLQVTQRGCASPLAAPQTITITSTAAETSAVGLTLVPNPAQQRVQLTSTTALREVTLRELTGRLLLRQALGGANTAELALPRLPAGTYLLTATGADGGATTRRLLIAP